MGVSLCLIELCINELLVVVGVDMDWLKCDFIDCGSDIDVLFKCNNEQVEVFGFSGMLLFIVGKYCVFGVFSMVEFEQVIVDVCKVKMN